MSDQPTTGEWTADTVEGIAVPAFIECRDGYVEVADAHNASLAAERDAGYEECRELWQQDVQQLRQQLREQLAAEQEKYARSQEKVREYFDLLAAEREKLRQATVSAEREKVQKDKA